MEITNIGIQLNLENALNEVFETYQEKTNFHLMPHTNFSQGIVSFEDAFLLPHGTFVVVHDGKENFIGRVCRYKHTAQSFKNIKYSTAIVPYYYDIQSVTNEKLTYDRNHKISNIYDVNVEVYIRKSSGKILQCVNLKYDEVDEWKFVKISYGNHNIKMYSMYGWQYRDNMIYQKMSLDSNLLSIYGKYFPVYYIQQEEYSEEKQTNIGKIEPTNVMFVPYELCLYIVCLFLFVFFFIFKERIIIWSILLFSMLLVRRNLRKKYQ